MLAAKLVGTSITRPCIASPITMSSRNFAKRVFFNKKKKTKKVVPIPEQPPIPAVPTPFLSIPTVYTHHKHIHGDAMIIGDCTTMRQKNMEITEKGAQRIKISAPPSDVHMVIRAVIREKSGKYAAEWNRKEGLIPCSITTHHKGQVMNIAIEPYFIEKLRNIGAIRAAVFAIEIPGYAERFRCVIKNFLVDSVSNKAVTVQFLLVDPHRDYKIKMPVHLKGMPDCIGIKRGGILLQPTRGINLVYKKNLANRMGATSIPTGVNIDVVDRNITDSIHVYDIPLPPYLHVPKDSPIQRHVLMTFTKNLG